MKMEVGVVETTGLELSLKRICHVEFDDYEGHQIFWEENEPHFVYASAANNRQQRHYVFESSVRPLSFDTCFRLRDISVLSGGILMKFATNIHHVRSVILSTEVNTESSLHFRIAHH